MKTYECRRLEQFDKISLGGTVSGEGLKEMLNDAPDVATIVNVHKSMMSMVAAHLLKPF
jgi:hypothetical protein